MRTTVLAAVLLTALATASAAQEPRERPAPHEHGDAMIGDHGDYEHVDRDHGDHEAAEHGTHDAKDPVDLKIPAAPAGVSLTLGPAMCHTYAGSCSINVLATAGQTCWCPVPDGFATGKVKVP